MRARLRSLVPIVALSLGVAFSPILYPLKPLIPYIISGMLFLTFLKIRPRDLALRRSHWVLLTIQITLALGAYLAIAPWSQMVAIALALCILTPAATAGPAIVQIIGGEAGYMTAYILLSHVAIIVIAPLVLPYVNPGYSIGFFQQAMTILMQVAQLIVPAIVLAWLIVWRMPRLADRINRYRQGSYWLWLFSLVLLMGYITRYIQEKQEFSLPDLMMMFVVGLVSTVGLFGFGHWLALRLGIERHAGRHSLGQKNTTLSLWIASLFLPPLTAMSIAAYIIWQNIALSIIMAKYRR